MVTLLVGFAARAGGFLGLREIALAAVVGEMARHGVGSVVLGALARGRLARRLRGGFARCTLARGGFFFSFFG